jgi:hypothetical protein
MRSSAASPLELAENNYYVDFTAPKNPVLLSAHWGEIGVGII